MNIPIIAKTLDSSIELNASRVGSVFETYDYDSIINPAFNRDINYAHVKKLVKEITAKYRPSVAIVVAVKIDGVTQLVIIDGQHRLEAAKRLELPFRFIIWEDNSIDTISDTFQDMHKLNTGQKNWPTLEYIKSYSKNAEFKHRVHYQRLLALLEDYNYTFATTTLTTLMGNGITKKSAKDITSGAFRITKAQERMVREYCDLLMDFVELDIPHCKLREFASAFMCLRSNPKYDHDTMISRMDKYVTPAKDPQAIWVALANAYNDYNRRKVNFQYVVAA